ncbi:MAG: long-chain fatty acid--CoA ligase [Saprospiraceae bacterium]|jgi:long-chain acyl-CoA synthetase|nr:long-chain fatty acid--CoA ligase [Saprospiraceae bacterium]
MAEKRLFDYLYDQMEQYPLEKAFGHKVNGVWEYFSTVEMVRRVNQTSCGLLELGLKPGDKVATVVYQTSPAWVVLEFAMAQIGILNVPMYPTISAREYEYILRESEARFCFVGDKDLYDKVHTAQANLPGLQEIIAFGEHLSARNWEFLLQGDPSRQAEVDRIKSGIRADEVMTLVYTSGTTGNPKGVMLTHTNIVFNIEAMRRLLRFQPGDRVLSFLPVSHIFERVAVYAFTAMCGSVTFTGTENLGGETGDLRAIRPHFFTTVPRLLEKVYEKIVSKGLELKGIKRFLFFWALNLTDHWHFDHRPSGFMALKWWLADRLIFSKWREALGGCVKTIVTGASACPVRVMRTFNAAGIPVREGYGMTEAAPALSFSRVEPEGAMLGTVGPLLDGVEVRLEPDPDFRPGEGEILAKSPGVMVGYYQQPDKTAEVIREINGERWLATGDVGAWVEGPTGLKFLKITDRKKELLKTSQGKYVAPAPIESALKEHFLIEQAMVVGDDRKFVTALLVPSQDGLRDWCQRHQIPWTSLAEMVHKPEVLRRYEMLLERINPAFARHEQIKKFVLLPQPWEPVKSDGSDAELTPTLKLKRRVILQKFEREIEGMYAE